MNFDKINAIEFGRCLRSPKSEANGRYFAQKLCVFSRLNGSASNGTRVLRQNATFNMEMLAKLPFEWGNGGLREPGKYYGERIEHNGGAHAEKCQRFSP